VPCGVGLWKIASTGWGAGSVVGVVVVWVAGWVGNLLADAWLVHC
jgi:hypothetical protein